jgi:hypothetical protein
MRKTVQACLLILGLMAADDGFLFSCEDRHRQWRDHPMG